MSSQIHILIKKISAPLDFVYDWCTDFREDDPQLTGSNTIEKIIEKTKEKAVFTLETVKDGRIVHATETVYMHPPDYWHLDFIGDECDEIGDYNLTSEGNQTKLTMKFEITYKNPKFVTSKEEWEKSADEYWDKLIIALENDYKNNS